MNIEKNIKRRGRGIVRERENIKTQDKKKVEEGEGQEVI
jgi:hypothetical protein